MRCYVAIVGLAVCLSWALPSRAQIPLCLNVRADDEDLKNFAKLVRAELGHHPTHRPVDQGCRSTLFVGLFRVAGVQYLTGRIDQEIPVRHKIEDSQDLAGKLKYTLSLVLHNDPIYLAEDIAQYSVMQRAAHSILKRGTNTYRMELFQNISFIAGTGEVAFASGGAASVTRGSGNWNVLARIYAGGRPDQTVSGRKVLRAMTGAGGAVTYEFSALASTTFYISAGAGLQFVRFEGQDPDDRTRSASINQILAVLSTRVGVRFFRMYDFDFDLYAAADLPLHPTNDVDVSLFGEGGAWTPSVQVGIGVGF